MREIGLYYPDGTFRSRDEIVSNVPTGDNLIFVTPLATDSRSFGDWATIFQRRQNERKAARGIPEHIEIAIQTQYPILYVPLGDVHAGGEDVAYDLFANDLRKIAETPGVFTTTLGDITDSYFWGKDAQDEQIGAYVEQNHFLQAGLRTLADNKKLLAGWGGDHDMWAGQSGETVYTNFGKDYGAHFLHGVSYITLGVGNEKYKISGAHRHNGFSIYNKAHPALRLYRDSAEGSDIIVTAHTHDKAILPQPVKRFGGEANMVYFVSIGAYKRSDGYSRKKGFHRKGDDELGPVSFLLYPDEKRIVPFTTLEQGVEILIDERVKYAQRIQHGNRKMDQKKI